MKMKIIYILSLIISVAINASAEESKLYEMKIGQFDKVRVLDNVHVVYRCLPDSSGFARFYGKAEFEDAFILSCKDNGTLKIQVSTEDVGMPDLPILYIYSDYLTSVENSSTFSLTVENPAPCAEFKVTQVGNGFIRVDNVEATKVSTTLNTGNGTVIISGSCDKADFKMVGTGLISADRLKAEDVQCKILGTGSIACWALERLNVKGLGTTKIYYKGNPTIKKSGGGKLEKLLLSDENEEEQDKTVVRIDD